MGTWALEFNPGAGGSVYKMVCFNGELFAFVFGGAGGGVWRRTPPNWTQTFPGSGSNARGAMWNNLLFWGEGPPPGLWPNQISRSEDGVTWVLDYDAGGGGPFTSFSAIGGYGDYLYTAHKDFNGLGGFTSFRRDTDGNWTLNPPWYSDNNYGNDMIGYGNYVYWCDGSDCYRYRTAWERTPTLDDDRIYYFQVYNGILFAIAGEAVYRKTAGGWLQEFSISAPWGFEDVSEGADGNLWLAAEDGVNSRVYTRIGSHWVLHSTAAGVRFKSACFGPSGDLLAGTHDCRFYVYTPDFNVSPVGGGLYPEALDVDADGNALFVGLYDAAAQPILVKAALPLTAGAMGAAVFNPGGGSAINVKCLNRGGQLVTSGDFGASQIETSDDGGATFTDISDAGWGGETVQPVLPDPNDLDKILAFLAVAQDAVETEDGGATWDTNNPALGFAPEAAAKLAEGDEVILSESPAGQVHYSPNRAHDLAGIGGPADVTALEVK